jgi:hypothetical protein
MDMSSAYSTSTQVNLSTNVVPTTAASGTPSLRLQTQRKGCQSQYTDSDQPTHLNFFPGLTHEQRGPLGTPRAFFTLIPSVARADRETRTVRGKGERGDGGGVARVLAEALFDLVVPDGDGGV